MRGKGEINSLPHNRNRKQRVIWEVLRQGGYVLFKLIIQHEQPESNTLSFCHNDFGAAEMAQL